MLTFIGWGLFIFLCSNRFIWCKCTFVYTPLAKSRFKFSDIILKTFIFVINQPYLTIVFLCSHQIRMMLMNIVITSRLRKISFFYDIVKRFCSIKYKLFESTPFIYVSIIFMGTITEITMDFAIGFLLVFLFQSNTKKCSSQTTGHK